ncbi:MAG: ABC transporter permease, partial [Acutalibacteraceae bacterium]|nr:ABC transporter permease [Acutalibacteraceae bacterium]
MNEKTAKAKKIPMKNYLKNAYKYRYLVQEIVRKNIKLQYRNSFLGMFWTFLQPLFTMIVLVLIFSNVFGSSSSGVVCYPVYVLCGRLIYECFSQSTKRAMRSIRNSASIIKKVYVPKYVYPLSNVLAN